MSVKRSIKIGDPAPDLAFLTVDGKEMRLSNFRGKRVLLFIWASWCACREQLAEWQAFYRKHRDGGVEIIGVAMDAQGAAAVRPFIEQAKVEFSVVIDSVDCLWEQLGFDYIPNGYYVDERGVIRYLKVGGFDIRDKINRKIIEDLISDKWGKNPARNPERPKLSFKKQIIELNRQLKPATRGIEKRLKLCELLVKTGHYKRAAKEYDTILKAHPKNVRALFSRGVVAHRLGKFKDALVFWSEAFALEPNNWVIRKQIWALESPSHFYPHIDYNWQNEQVRKDELRLEAESKSRLKAKAHRM